MRLSASQMDFRTESSGELLRVCSILKPFRHDQLFTESEPSPLRQTPYLAALRTARMPRTLQRKDAGFLSRSAERQELAAVSHLPPR